MSQPRFARRHEGDHTGIKNSITPHLIYEHHQLTTTTFTKAKLFIHLSHSLKASLLQSTCFPSTSSLLPSSPDMPSLLPHPPPSPRAPFLAETMPLLGAVTPPPVLFSVSHSLAFSSHPKPPAILTCIITDTGSACSTDVICCPSGGVSPPVFAH